MIEECCYIFQDREPTRNQSCLNRAKFRIDSKEPYSDTYACFWHLAELSDPQAGDVITRLEEAQP